MVASLWNASDIYTTTLTAPLPISNRQSKIGNATFFWAGFTLVGEGSESILFFPSNGCERFASNNCSNSSVRIKTHRPNLIAFAI